MISRAAPIQIPAGVEEKLKDVRAARRQVRLALAAVLGVLTLLLAMSAAMFVDWSVTLFDPFWRSVLTGLALSIVGVTVIVGCSVAWWRGRRLTAVAREIDIAVPRIEERWWTVAELAAAPLEQQRAIHTGMMDWLARESTAFEPQVSSENVVSRRGLLYAVLAVCAVIVGLLVACLIDWEQTRVLVMRFWAPTANISATQLETAERDLVAARGEPLLLESHQQGRRADDATLFLRGQNGQNEADADSIMLSAVGAEADRFVHRIRSADEAFGYRFRAGDGQTRWVGVTVADRPELAGVRFRAVPPDYTGRDAVNLNELPDRVTVVEGSRVDIALRPRDAATAVQLRLGDDSRQTLARDANGWHRFRTTLQEDITITAFLTEKHGLENKRPPVCRIKVYRDQPPSVKIASPTEGMAARPNDEIEIAFTASDDFGVAKAELVIYDDGAHMANGLAERLVLDIPLGEQAGSATVNRSVPLDLSQFQLEDGQTLSFAVRVYDTRQAVTMSAGGSDDSQRTTEPPSDEAANMTVAATSNATDTGESGDTAAESLDASTDEDRPSESASARSTDRSSAPNPIWQAATTQKQSGAATPQPDSTIANSRSSEASARSLTSPSTNASAREAPTSPATASDNRPTTPDNRPRTQTPLATADAQVTATDPGRLRTSNLTREATADGRANTPTNTAASSTTSSGNNTGTSASGSDNGSQQTGAPRPPDGMTRRVLDIPQAGSSGLMRLKIDKWAGSFAGRQRAKLEMMISPRIEELDAALARAENRLKETHDSLKHATPWTGQQDQMLIKADEALSEAMRLVGDLTIKTAETPYAFIGLQLSEIADSHIVPAHDSVWIARQAEENPQRQPPIESAWQQTGRARQRLAQLITQYERIRREHHLTDAIETVKTMYQAFIEDAFALLLQQNSPINNYQRRIAELEVDEEYLRRLEEVLRMRQKLFAEFARILSEDPRLLRRFVDSINNQSESLRDQLTLLTLRQQELDGELQTWERLEESVRSRALSAIVQRKLEASITIAEKTAELQERFHAWSPLDLGIQQGDLGEARDGLAAIAAAAKQLEDNAASWRPPSITRNDAAQANDDRPAADVVRKGAALSEIRAEGRELYEQLRTLDRQFLEIAGRGDHPQLAAFLVGRLAETRRLIALTSGWVYQLNQLEAGNYPGAAAVEQHQLAEATNELTANLADLEQQLTGGLQREDGTLPADIAELSRKLLKTLDEEVAGSQLGAVFALRRNRLPTAAARTQDAVNGFLLAETTFDELFRRVIEEADKLPVQDPIADLLDDPTLDELLALLENEQDLAAALGIPSRPTNLQHNGDWLRPGSGMGGGIGSKLIVSQLNQRERLMNRAARRARGRAEAETKKASRRQSPRRIVEWNVLVSELDDRLLQGRGQLPPERYRRAIEQYFEELSRQVDDVEDQNP